MNILTVISYLGTAYHGSQIQKNANTIQNEFQKALYSVLGYETPIKACSRTDTGVHASCFCISFTVDPPIDPDGLCYALNNELPGDIRVEGSRVVDDDFHARYSAVGKRYVYRVFNGRFVSAQDNGRVYHFPYSVDDNKMTAAAETIVGTHDFSAFCGKKGIQEDMVRTVKRAEIVRDGKYLNLIFEADGFLYNMVRIMTGTLLNIGTGKLPVSHIEDALRTGERDRLMFTAPAEGLWLDGVIYGFGDANSFKR